MASFSPIDNNVGILAVEVYFPKSYVSQVDMEAANGVAAGKYTIGLGQDAMAFTGDQEDINSVALSVVHSLLEKYQIDPKEIGRLEVGTETIIDKSKSTKTVLMTLFEQSGNHDIEGATVINACYGGTAALLNALMWVDSTEWDGRYAIVVAADIAVYADGPARPTGGCGSVALLIGRDAPLKIDLRTRTTYAVHAWDFFKPNLESEYPIVNGALSQTVYLQSLDDCYTRFVQKCKEGRGEDMTTASLDHMLFHSPYNKLVQKGFGRLLFVDAWLGQGEERVAQAVQQWVAAGDIASTYEDKALEAVLKTVSVPGYKQKVALACELSKQIGNTYTASVYLNLANLVSAAGDSLVGQKVALYSYGSGSLASMFAIVPRISTSHRFSLGKMQSALDLPGRLARREKLTPGHLAAALAAREAAHGQAPFAPTFTPDSLFPGTYYLKQINALQEREYARKPLA